MAVALKESKMPRGRPAKSQKNLSELLEAVAQEEQRHREAIAELLEQIDVVIGYKFEP
jgi:hypothetical protein